jgi:2'-5' RNA ligase
VPPEANQTAIVVPVPAAEPVVAAWRERFDPSAAAGMPAHITVLSPFLSAERLTGATLARLRNICAESPTLDVVFTRTGRFPDVLYLEPEPATGLRQLTAAIAEQWPEAPPYGGRYDEVVPHLTVATGADADALSEVEVAVVRELPLRAWLVEARVYVYASGRWQQEARLPFGFRDS